jgi:hypothetical protein
VIISDYREFHEDRPVNGKRTLMKGCSLEFSACMAKPRSIAPWHREGLEEADLEAMSPESVELLASLKGEAGDLPLRVAGGRA